MASILDATMGFTLLSEPEGVEVIAEGRGVRVGRLLRRQYGGRSWRKMKGTATVELEDGTIHHAEIHWYEAHGIGRKRFKIKRVFWETA